MIEGSGCGFTCYFCGGGITNWENDNDPLVEHARLFPNCGHIRLYMGPHFVQTVRELAKSPERVTFDNVIQSLGPMAFTISHITMDHDVAVRVMLEFGFDKEHVLKAARDLRQEGCQLTVDALKQRIDQNTGIMLHGHEATMIDTTTNEVRRETNEGEYDDLRVFQLMLDTTPQDSLETTPQDSLDTTPQDSLETTPQDSLEATPQDSLETTPQDSLETTPQDSLDTTPQDSLETTPQDSLDTTPQDSLDTTPQDSLETTPQDSLETTLQDSLDTTPQDSLETTP
ncbi:Baculoviral IAP repeat-containing protein 3 [Bulinus truncatus]|nr:Baculoviral IAP repeat-containing protein 3 [Bulinus truncatus]